jgi:NADH:ubiquinone oxidoreductase subunit E
MGTACYINGAAAILQRIHDQLGIDAGGTTADGRISLLRARCLGACSMAPAVVVDDEVHGRMSPDGVEKMLEAV